LISQGKGAEIAGLTRAGFLKALSDAKVDALQVTPEELKAELEFRAGWPQGSNPLGPPGRARRGKEVRSRYCVCFC